MENQSCDLVEFLLLENNQEDILLLENTFEENKLFNKIITVRTINEAVELIYKAKLNLGIIHPNIALISLSSLLGNNEINRIVELKNPVLESVEVYILTNDEVEEDLLNEHGIHFPTIRRPFVFCNFIETILLKDSFKQAIIKTN